MKKTIVPICAIIFLTFIGCYLITMEYVKQKAQDEGKIIAEEEIKEEELIGTEAVDTDRGILAVYISNDEKEHKLLMQDISSGKRYDLPYTHFLSVKNKYGDVLTLEEIIPGEIFKLDYSVHSGKLSGIQISDDTWTYSDVTRFSFDEKKRIMSIADEMYQLSDNLLIFSKGKKIKIMDINEYDTLIVKGDGKRIVSVIVDKGHGYLRLKNDVYFVGGFIEVGQSIIKPITEDMLFPVPEGTYSVRVTNRGYEGKEEIKIKRDRETEFDFAKVEIKEVAIGHILFNIVPDYAQLYVDDEITEFTDRVPLEYGIHSIRVECNGYETVKSNIKVGNGYADMDIVLDEITEDTSSSSTEKTSSSVKTGNSNAESTSSSMMIREENDKNMEENKEVNEADDTSSSTSSSSYPLVSAGRKIYVENPRDVRVYLDGNYIGEAPTSAAKVTGVHVITLSREGFFTKSYTVNIDDDDKDVTLSFSELSTEE